MPQFASYPQVTIIAPTDTFLINQAVGGVKQIEFQDVEASLSLSVIPGVLPIAKGGTGSNLTSPGQDAIVFWDNSAAAIKFLSIGDGLQIVGTVLSNTVTGGGGGGGAPIGATYWTSVPNADLTNEFALSTLATGLVKNTAVTGVPSIAIAGTDYAVGPGSSTANGLVRFNGTGGGTYKDSGVTLADAGVAFVFPGASGLTSSGSNQNVTLTPSGTGFVSMSTGFKTGNPNGAAGLWRTGKVTVGAVTADTTSYVEVLIDGAVIKLIKAS